MGRMPESLLTTQERQAAAEDNATNAQRRSWTARSISELKSSMSPRPKAAYVTFVDSTTEDSKPMRATDILENQPSSFGDFVIPESLEASSMDAEEQAKSDTRFMIVLLLVYFSQGIMVLGGLAMAFFLKDRLGLSPAESAIVSGAISFGWILKPVYGFISDSFPIRGYRRKPYLFLSGIVLFAAQLLTAFVCTTIPEATAYLLLSAVAIAFADVLVDSVLVEKSKGKTGPEAAKLQSSCFFAKTCGEFIGALVGGFLLEHIPIAAVFCALGSIGGGIACLGSFILYERRLTSPPGPNKVTVTTQLSAIKGAFMTRSFVVASVVLFLLACMPSCGSAMFYFYTNELHFGPSFIGIVTLSKSVAHLAGLGIYRVFLVDKPFVGIVFGATLVGTLLRLVQLVIVTRFNLVLGIPDQWFVIGDSAILAAVSEVVKLPLFTITALLCPSGVEGTLFALLMTERTLAHMVSQYSGAGLTALLGVGSYEFTYLWLLVLICNLSSLLPLPLVFVAGFPASGIVDAASMDTGKAALAGDGPTPAKVRSDSDPDGAACTSAVAVGLADARAPTPSRDVGTDCCGSPMIVRTITTMDNADGSAQWAFRSAEIRYALPRAPTPIRQVPM